MIVKNSITLACATLMVCVAAAAQPRPTGSEKQTCYIEVFAVDIDSPSGKEMTVTARVSATTSCVPGSALLSITAIPDSASVGEVTFVYTGDGKLDVRPGNTMTTSFTATEKEGKTGSVRFRVSRASCGAENRGCEPPSSSIVSDIVAF